ncbi:hypothetical protein K435DRAFT_699639 [Dendrothele bispora CBS 962.96]|uniref:hAT-like transposase RNase-H fold domain-containing protein n=1 Tax=Dendrothele bispora (strain CBS 962.96) TaxID=1314807 RepID=A0A4S8KS89_DENBC|nr:hypothetical protein K435DRAFT_699639 [Dendrothele bispora CBS 962.96]
MIKSLETILVDCPAGPSTHVRCMGHTIQLVVGSILDPFKAVQKRKIGNVIVEVDEDEEAEEDYADDALLDGGGSDEENEPADGDEDDDDDDNHNGNDSEEVEEQNDQPGGNEDMAFGVVISEGEWKSARAIVRKVQTLAQKIHWSESLRAELKAHCKREHITFKTVKRIVKTRWNTYAIMFESVLYLRKALDRLCKSHPHDLPYLDTQEWDLLQGLYDMLNVNFPFIPMSIKA